MGSCRVQIEKLARPVTEAEVRGLAELLADAVDSGAAVSFLQPLTRERAAAWWRETVEAGVRAGAVVLVARDDGGIAGTVQLQPAWAPNQPHRAEVCKLIVHRRARGRGLGRALMERVEQEALSAGRTLLTLDARRDGAAVELYRKMGWTEVGVIPRFAVNADGRGYHDTVVFWKELAPAPALDGRKALL